LSGGFLFRWLTSTLNLTFAAGFAGNRVFYLAARDVNEPNDTGYPPGVSRHCRRNLNPGEIHPGPAGPVQNRRNQLGGMIRPNSDPRTVKFPTMNVWDGVRQ
jgi:hypothetical protein